MKGRTKKETGGYNAPEEDVKDAPERRNNAKKIFAEAEERKNGGKTEHGKECKCRKCRGGMARKEGGKVEGECEAPRADRKPRKSGGSATSNPFSSARAGTPAPGRKVQSMD